jgi:hypothetical protein
VQKFFNALVVNPGAGPMVPTAICPASLTLSTGVNQPTFSVGDTVNLSLAVDNPGVPGTADVYLALVLPDGRAAFVTALPVTADVIAWGDLLDVASYRPLARNVPLESPVALGTTEFSVYEWTGDEPRGEFALFFLAVTPGALDDGVIEPEEILASSQSRFSF